MEEKRQARSGSVDDRVQELEQVVSCYLPMFYRRAYRVLGNAPDAEDAVQDALLSACEHFGQFRGQAKISTWLTVIVTNAALLQLRRRRAHYLSLEQPQGADGLTYSERLADSRPGPDQVCSAVQAHERLVSGIDQLSPRLRRTFQLRDIDGLSTREAALVLGVPEGTVKAQLSRARAKLAGTLRQIPHQGTRATCSGSPSSIRG